MWDYRDTYTCAQLDLIALDVPLVVYDSGKQKRKKGEPKEFKKANALDVLNKAEEWERKYSGDDKTTTFNLTQFKTK